MYLRFTRRRKNGKEHRSWGIVESRRCSGGRVVQRPVLYLGEINDSQHGAWSRVIETFDEGSQRPAPARAVPGRATRLLSTDRSRKRVAIASAVVRAECDGGSARRGLFAGREERALPLPRQAAGAQGGAVRSLAGALAGSVRRQVRGSAVRSDEHLFRVRSAGQRRRQTSARLQPRQAQRLRAR